MLKALFIAASLLGASATPAPYGWVAEYEIAKRDTSFPSTISPSCVDFIIGADTSASTGKQVCVSVDPASHNLTVTYPTSPNGYSYVKEHVWVGCSAPTANNPKAPGQSPFTTDKGYCVNSADNTYATCTFNIDTILAGCKSCDKSFYIVTHASLTKTLPGGTTSSVTGAGQGPKFDNAWHRMYWNPTFYCLCTSTYTFEPSTFYVCLPCFTFSWYMETS